MRARGALVIAVLGLVLIALLVEVKRVWQRPRRGGHSEPPAEAEAPAPARPLAELPSSSPFGRMTLPPRRSLRAGIAHLRGRVVPAATADGESALGTIDVKADDGRRAFEARVVPGGGDRFELHVPPGRYTLTARATGLIAVERNLLLAAGAERDVLLRLEPAVEVSGRVRGAPKDASLFALAFRAGGKIDQGDGEIDGDTFSFEGLRSGEAYDLVLGGKGIRTVTLGGVTAPAEGLEVSFERLPVVRGAIGFARGAACPFTRVGLAATDSEPAAAGRGGGGDDDDDGTGGSSIELGADCRFELPIEKAAPVVTVVATGPGWHAEEEVAIPPAGDPDPICINPPCRADPLEGSAELVVSLERPGRASVETGIAASAGTQSCSEEEGASCALRGLPAGEPIEIVAGGAGCLPATRTMVLGAGANHVSLPCGTRETIRDPGAPRRVQGILRTAAGEAPERLAIRCAGAGSERNLYRTLVFSVACPRAASTLEYQITEDGPWTAVMIPGSLDPAFVEIAVGL